MIKTRQVSKHYYKNYLERAEDCYETMNDRYSKSKYISAVINAIHCCISAADALTIFFKEQRHSGENHLETISLLKTLDITEFSNKIDFFSQVVRLKNNAEYGERNLSKNDADTAVRNTEKFFKFVKNLLRE